MKRIIQKLSINTAACKRILSYTAIFLFLFTFAPDLVESRRFGGRSFSRSFSRSSSRSYSAPKRTTSRSRSTYTKPSTTRSTRSTSSSYSGNRTTTNSTRASTARQKQTATTRAKTTNTSATRNTAQNRKQVRQLKSENRSLKRKVTTANRQTSQARRQQRSTITVNNFGGYYPMGGYSMYSLSASMAFNNIMFGIYFHDYYNHSIRHSYLWHYHHRDYDRSHWDAEKQAEYERYKEYYESQGVEQNANFVDPGTNADENYVASYVEENPDKFYGENVEVVTVEELPDEEALKQELFASAETPSLATNTQRAPPTQQKLIVQNKTSGGTWFVLIFGSLLIVGVISLVLYNKGYF